MQLVLLEGFGTAVTGISWTGFLRTCSDGLDGFSGLDFLTGLDGFQDFLDFLSDWIGSVFLDFLDLNLILRLVFLDSVWFFQRFGTVGFFKDLVGSKDKRKNEVD